MSGSALMDFFITCIVLAGAGALFFLTVDKIAPDETMKKIGKIAVGVILLVVFLLAIKAVLFGGGGAIVLGGSGIITFAIGVIVILVVLYLIDLLLSWLASNMGIAAPIVSAVKYVVFAVALIALLVLCDRAFFGGRYVYAPLTGDTTPTIMRPAR
jgi:hypothetical protein